MNLHFTDITRWKNISNNDWNNWKWQLQNSVRTLRKLRKIISHSNLQLPTQNKIIEEINDTFEMKLTPHTILNIYNAIESGDFEGVNSLLSAFLPTVNEKARVVEDGIDSIGEELEHSKPASLVTNFYKNRVLLFAANTCPAYCRFCFRRRKVGDNIEQDIERGTDRNLLEEAIEYIEKNKNITEVIVSGGDPLTLGDNRIINLLERLKGINHIKVLRIDTKVFTTLPQRITDELVDGLTEFKPIYIVGNFLHSVELTPETINAIAKFVDSGIPVFSHTPLLKNVNDDPEKISNLMWKLFLNRVTPYYLIQFIPTKWTEHFRVPISKGLEIMDYLHGRLSGIANPTYIVYLPEGAGKVPILPEYILDRTDEGYYFKNYEGKRIFYKEPRIND